MRNVLAILIIGLLSMGASKCGGDEEENGGAGAGGAGAGGAAGKSGAGGAAGKSGAGGSGGTSSGGSSGGGGGGNTCADQGEKCTGPGSAKCCDGLNCCTGIPVPAGEEFCGTICPMSDRNSKQGFTPIAPEAVLDGLMSLPITTWRYKDEPAGTSHIGPMAQDFKATFRVGKDERYIATGDADGVALAAIKAVSEKLDRLEAEQRKLRAENAVLRAELSALRARQADRR